MVVTRVSPQEIRPRVQSRDALLVCAYQKEEKFTANHLDGAISFTDFQAQLATLDKSQEIVFYCA